jgi:hypothetical protein
LRRRRCPPPSLTSTPTLLFTVFFCRSQKVCATCIQHLSPEYFWLFFSFLFFFFLDAYLVVPVVVGGLHFFWIWENDLTNTLRGWNNSTRFWRIPSQHRHTFSFVDWNFAMLFFYSFLDCCLGVNDFFGFRYSEEGLRFANYGELKGGRGLERARSMFVEHSQRASLSAAAPRILAFEWRLINPAPAGVTIEIGYLGRWFVRCCLCHV